MCGHIAAIELEDSLEVEHWRATCFLVGEYQHDNLTLWQVPEYCRILCSEHILFKRVNTAAEHVLEVTFQVIKLNCICRFLDFLYS